MVGMHEMKTNIVNQILYYVQNMHIGGNDYKHIVISGPPGTGKTEIAKIMGAIFSKLGGSDEPVFKKATRADLIAGYVGQTAIKTRALIDKCIGGVLFIDEAYSFGDDIFSKECADTLCEALSAHKDNLTVIVAGYEDKLNEQFFSLNPGLESRFSWRYNIHSYSAAELHDIYLLKVKQQGWTTDSVSSWFDKHGKYFTGQGRDIETLLFKVKIAHSNRVFGTQLNKKHISVDDLNAGFKVFMEHKTKSEEFKSREVQKSLSLMYM
jgi:replication-associated recombination protein RarA